MTTLTDPVLHEVLDQWLAWQTLVRELLPPGHNATTADPAEVEAALAGMSIVDLTRFMYLLVGHCHGDTLEEAADLLCEIRERLVRGERPRFWCEVEELRP